MVSGLATGHFRKMCDVTRNIIRHKECVTSQGISYDVMSSRITVGLLLCEALGSNILLAQICTENYVSKVSEDVEISEYRDISKDAVLPV